MQIDIVKATSSSKLISDCNDYELSQVFIKVYWLIGLKKHFYPNQEEDQFIFNYIKQNYGHRNIDEIYLAFDWAIKKVFEVETNPYDQFSIPYFVKVFDEYRNYLKKLNKEKQIEKQKEIDMPQTTDEEKLKDIEEYRIKDLDFKLIPLFLFDYLIQLKLIDFNEQRKYEVLSIALDLREQELRNDVDKNGRLGLKEYKEMIKAGYLEGKEKIVVQNLARRVAIRDYYKQLKQKQ